MPRRRVDHRGVRFGISVNRDGYQWQRITHVNSERDVLAPAGQTEVRGDGSIAFRDITREITWRPGLAIARRAFNRFRELAEAITRGEPLEEVFTGDDGSYLDQNDDQIVMTYPADPDEARRLVVDYANTFGTLWGDNDPRTLGDWVSEAAEFLALYDVSQVLKPGADASAFEARVKVKAPYGRWVPAGAPPGSLEYTSDRPFVLPMAIARVGQTTRSRRAPNALEDTVDYFERALSGSPKVRARMLLSRRVNSALAGGLSWGTSAFDDHGGIVMPHHLIHLLYLRLWFDAVDHDGHGHDRQRTCRYCGLELDNAKTRRREYCDDQCRTDFHNRKRARSR